MTMERLNVLVVDDSLLATQVLKSALEDLGHRVVRTASTGTEALSAYKVCNPDIVTMDVAMPGMSGIEATEKIMKSYPDARIIMVSSHAQQGVIMGAIKAGAKSFLLKPIKPDKLRDVLEQVVNFNAKT
jgi:two-component system, chemotaxis family, chemotaxis protein CheY